MEMHGLYGQENFTVALNDMFSGDRVHVCLHTTNRSFSAAAPALWNNLPLPIRSAQSIEVFKSLLKTHLFSLDFNCT